MYRKSSGKSRKNGNSVEPGLPKMVVIPKSRRRSKVASRTVPIMPYLPLRSLSHGGYTQIACLGHDPGVGDTEAARETTRAPFPLILFFFAFFLLLFVGTVASV